MTIQNKLAAVLPSGRNHFPHWRHKASCVKPVPLALGGKNLLSAGYSLMTPQSAVKEISICSY